MAEEEGRLMTDKDFMLDRMGDDPGFAGGSINEITGDLFQDLNQSSQPPEAPQAAALPPSNPATLGLAAAPASALAASRNRHSTATTTRKRKKKYEIRVGPKNKGGKRAQFSQEETTMLLDKIQEVIPIGPEDWKKVCNYFNSKVDESRKRMDEGIRRKYNTLVATRVPAGDPNMPNDALRAKTISQMIYMKCLPGNGGGKEAAQGAKGDDGDDTDDDLEEDADDDDDDVEEVEMTTPAMERHPLPSSISIPSAKRRSTENGKPKDEEGFLETFIKISNMQMQQNKLAMDMQLQQGKLAMEQNRVLMEQLMKQNMVQSQMMLNAFLTGVNGIINTYVSLNNANPQPAPVAAAPPLPSVLVTADPAPETMDSDSEKLSSIYTDDSNPHVEASTKAGKKLSKKARSKSRHKSQVKSPVTSPIRNSPRKRPTPSNLPTKANLAAKRPAMQTRLKK